jgi:hypothetical protein
MAKVRIVPAKEISSKTLRAEDYVKRRNSRKTKWVSRKPESVPFVPHPNPEPLWDVRKKGDEKKAVLFRVRGYTWFKARERACIESDFNIDEIEVDLAEGEQSPHAHGC